MWLTITLLFVGIVLILFGADKLTDGAIGLARRFNISEIVIGLTIVAFGTSLPEFVASFTSSLKGIDGLSVGNIIGSNIFNILMIVGCSALFAPVQISKSTISKDIPYTILATLVIIVVSLDLELDGTGNANFISRTDGLLMLGFFSIFLFYTFSIAQNKENNIIYQSSPMSYIRIFLYVVFGLASLILGGNLFVDAASKIALNLGVSETVVGLTIVATGTSLPELATSIIAARKGSSAIAIGNVIGSNIFNIFFVTGFCATIRPMSVNGISYTDLGVLILSALMFWCFSYTKRTIERWEGGIMVVLYLIYIGSLVYNA